MKQTKYRVIHLSFPLMKSLDTKYSVIKTRNIKCINQLMDFVSFDNLVFAKNLSRMIHQTHAMKEASSFTRSLSNEKIPQKKAAAINQFYDRSPSRE